MKQFRCPDGSLFWNSPTSGRETKFIYAEVFEDHCYEKHGITVKDGDVVFDVGANIGMFVRSLIGRFQDLRLYCFEPVPNTRACLERNIADASASHDVTVLGIGLGAADGEMTIDFFPSHPGNSTLHLGEKQRELQGMWEAKTRKPVTIALTYPFWPLLRRMSQNSLGRSEQFVCQVRTLSDVIRENDVQRIDLLKVDVEGAELDVLAGIEDWSLIRQVAMELSPANKPQIGPLSDRLRAHGFSVVTEDLGDGEPAMLYAVRGD